MCRADIRTRGNAQSRRSERGPEKTGRFEKKKVAGEARRVSRLGTACAVSGRGSPCFASSLPAARFCLLDFRCNILTQVLPAAAALKPFQPGPILPRTHSTHAGKILSDELPLVRLNAVLLLPCLSHLCPSPKRAGGDKLNARWRAPRTI